MSVKIVLMHRNYTRKCNKGLKHQLNSIGFQKKYLPNTRDFPSGVRVTTLKMTMTPFYRLVFLIVCLLGKQKTVESQNMFKKKQMFKFSQEHI